MTGADISANVAPMRDVNSATDMTTQAGVMSMNNPPDYGPPSAPPGAGGVLPPQIFSGTSAQTATATAGSIAARFRVQCACAP
jgi:hypothetical protein